MTSGNLQTPLRDVTGMSVRFSVLVYCAQGNSAQAQARAAELLRKDPANPALNQLHASCAAGVFSR